jgi:hypothetical protein
MSLEQLDKLEKLSRMYTGYCERVGNTNERIAIAYVNAINSIVTQKDTIKCINDFVSYIAAYVC